MLMVSMSKLTMVLSTGTVDLVRFRFFFFASAVWVAAIMAAAWEAAIFPVACRVSRSAATFHGVLRDAAGASSSLPTIESETYSSTGGAGATCTSAASQTL
jgi:hypothetical protein